MKKSIFILVMILGFLTVSFTSQETIWLDENLKTSTQDKAIYYKVGHKLEGEVSFFYKGRTIYRKVFFVDGKMEGNFAEYYNTGELRTSGKYKNGQKIGNWKTYYKNGKIKEKGRYNNGDKVGIWKIFYKND